jgi:uncharacterized tellurite resistance protein B-like protein
MSLAARLLALFGQTRGPSRERHAAEAELKLLVALAQADGVLSANETDELASAARRLLGDIANIQSLIREAQATTVDELAAEVRHALPRAARDELMVLAAGLAAADGDTSEMEAANLERLARLLGVPVPAQGPPT